jgi:hypothetical protein
MLQAQFQLGEQKIGMLGDPFLPPEAQFNYSTAERSNSAFLTKILAGKLPNSRPAIDFRFARLNEAFAADAFACLISAAAV